MIPEQQKKTVILLTIDALRADHLKSYGYHRNTAPYLEKFAEEGSIFLNAITNGPESPTAFSSLFTSILPLLDGGFSPLPPEKITLPQLLKENNINTFAIHSNPNLGKYFNFDRGFDTFLDGERYKKEPKNSLKLKLIANLKKILDYHNLSNKLMYRIKGFNRLKTWLRKKIPFLTDILLPFTPIAYNAPYVVNKLNSFLKTLKKPSFIWAHFMDVHSPYNPPMRNVLSFRKKDFNISERKFLVEQVYPNVKDIEITPKYVDDLKTLYDAEINFVDEYLALFLETVKKEIKNDCLIIITADHGESFYEHEFFGHQGTIFDEVLRVPLIIVELGKKSIKNKINDTIQLIDVTPTILDYYGIEIPDNFQGVSLLSLIKGKTLRKTGIIISECYQKSGSMKRNEKEGFLLLAIRNQGWKYIYDEENNTEFLFNLELDPRENNNLIDINKEKLSEFRTIKQHHLKKIAESSREKLKITKSIDKLDLDKFK
ncbi:MAG: sulfatase [Promethearchaeota archaeon]